MGSTMKKEKAKGSLSKGSKPEVKGKLYIIKKTFYGFTHLGRVWH